MKIGTYSYPLFRLNTLLKDTKIIYEKFGRKEITREHIAQVLGNTATSGGFSQKVADLRTYGLLSGSAGRYSVSDIGVKATFGNEIEKKEALGKAVRLVDLWVAIYEKCGIEPIQDTFWLDLAEITGIERPESQNKADAVRKAYMEDAKYILTVKAPSGKPESKNDEPAKGSEKGSEGARDRRPKVETTESAGFVHVKYPGCCDAIIDIHDEGSLSVVESLLNAIKAKIKIISENKTQTDNVSDDT